MSDRKDFFFRQLVTEQQLDDAFDSGEQADRNIMIDAGVIGIVSGLTVAQHSPTADLTVDVSAGVAYDQLGQRCAVAAQQVVDVSTDSLGVSTAVAAPGNERWVSVFLKFSRALSDPWLDGNNTTIFFRRDESFTIERVQGAEALIGAAAKPALGTDKILLADIQRTNGQTQVLTAQINPGTSRRENAFKFSSGAYAVATGTAEASDAAILGAFATFAAAIGSTGNPDGAAQIGARSVGSLASGTVRSQLDALNAGKAGLAGANTWTQTNTFTNRIEALGGIRRRPKLVLTDATGSISNPSLYDAIQIPNTLTADRNYSILDPDTTPPGATEGNDIYIYRRNPDADWQAFLYRGSDSALLITFPVVVGAWAILRVESGVWQVVAWGGGAVYNEASAP